MPAANTPLSPSWNGYISDTRDALILFEAVLSGPLSRVVRRPHDRERGSLIRSGAVFVYEEDRSGIKRWTDGVPWSPSRILNNFLIYRELDKPFPPGEKKRAKKPKRDQEDTAAGQEVSDGALASPQTPTGPVSPALKSDASQRQDIERALVGSLTDSYAFKPGGLVKKTMSVTVQTVHYHLVSYYTPEDVKASLLRRPGETHLRYVQPRVELTHQQNFRAPIDEGDEVVTTSPYANHQSRQQFIAAQPAYMQHPAYPTPAMAYQPTPSYYPQMPGPAPESYGEAHRGAYGIPPSPHAQQQFYHSMGRGQPGMHQQPQAGLPHQQQQDPQQHHQGQPQYQYQPQPQPRQQLHQYQQYPDMKHFAGQNPYQQGSQQMHSWSSPQG
ncbi:MAG: hypothetical protein M1828_004926 [Chrysothrix sp. TS-e1954]|nr:MAG: hypothetical protein M1828_004926 [Chrysothrix sp. TS-e1954]